MAADAIEGEALVHGREQELEGACRDHDQAKRLLKREVLHVGVDEANTGGSCGPLCNLRGRRFQHSGRHFDTNDVVSSLRKSNENTTCPCAQFKDWPPKATRAVEVKRQIGSSCVKQVVRGNREPGRIVSVAAARHLLSSVLGTGGWYRGGDFGPRLPLVTRVALTTADPLGNLTNMQSP